MTEAVGAGSKGTGDRSELRRAWLRVLAASGRPLLERALATIAGETRDVRLEVLRPPETGLVMVRGRMGGLGRRFNLGEVTVTRCAVTDGRVIGHGYVLGRDRGKALLVARCDAMLQLPGLAGLVRDCVVAPLRTAMEAEQALRQRRAAATRVDFFTLVRGDG
jgi:alpha-D-ribose 1-methylphosphonate 5-triphosphate synthase subunit PhnG